ncbi:MAG: asparagine synthetase B family protein [Alphaproteobacteria bacterium]
MTGICGWVGDIGHGTPPDEALSRMESCLDPSEAVNRFANVAGGLCVRSLLAAGHFYNDDRFRAAIVGKPYWSDPELSATVQRRGHGAALVEAYLDLGIGLFDHLHGRFAFTLLDSHEHAVLLAIDRVGIETMYFAQPADGLLVFATRAGSVAAHPSVSSTVSFQQIFNYLRLYRVPSPATIYEEQNKLLPGQYLFCSGHGAELKFYWEMPYEEENGAGFPELSAELRHVLRVGVERAVSGTERTRIGTFLSGGLDSSTVTGFLSELDDLPVKTFTIGFDAGGFDERHYAKVAARHFRADYHEYLVTPRDMFELMPRMAEDFDEPFGNSSAIPTYYCARLAKQNGVAVMLAGDGGDEIFGGNSRYVEQQIFELYRRAPQWLRKRLIEPLAFHMPGTDRLALLRKIRNYIRRSNIPLPERLESYHFYANEDISEAFEPEVLDHIDPGDPIRGMREVYERTASNSWLQRLMHLDLKLTLADNDLRKVTRMCRLAGVEVRYPFLDEDVVAFSARVPPSLMTKSLRLRYFYKRALKDFLPREVVAKTKHGFALPDGYWLKDYGPLRDLCFDNLESLKRRRIFRPGFIDRLNRLHRTDDAMFYGSLIWDLLMLELWLRKHNASISFERGPAIPNRPPC